MKTVTIAGMALLTFGCNHPEKEGIVDSAEPTADTAIEDTGSPASLEEMPLAGTWVTASDVLHLIDEETWMTDNDFSYRITVIDVENQYAIAQNHIDNPGYPDLWSRFEWTIGDHGQFYFCHSVQFAISQEDAEEEPLSDSQDMDSGCQNRPWTGLRPPIEIKGTLVDRQETAFTIDSWRWASNGAQHSITWLNANENWAVAYNDDQTNQWSKIHWIIESESTAYFCLTGEESNSEMEAASTTADRNNILTGCNGGEWTERRRPLTLYGDYEETGGDRFVVTSWTWTKGNNIWNIAYANSNALYAENHEDNDLFPTMWSRFNWINTPGSGLHYCQSVTNATSLEEAENATEPDTTNMAEGCLGNPWTKYRPVLNISGEYQDESGEIIDIDSWAWTVGDFLTNITHLRRTENWLVAKNAPTNTTLQTKWSKFKWFIDSNALLRWCWITNEADSEGEAYLTDADETDEESGCNGQAWGKLKERPPFIGRHQSNSLDLYSFGAFVYQSVQTDYLVYDINRMEKRFIASNGVNAFSVDWTHTDNCDQLPNADQLRQCRYICHGEAKNEINEAALTPHPNAVDLSTGCHGGPWTEIRKTPPFIGDFELMNGDLKTLTAFELNEGNDLHHLSEFDTNENWFTTYTDQFSENAPNSWHQFNWHIAGQSIFLCRVGYNQATEHLAKLMPLADETNLTQGCHLGSNLNEPWTEWRHALPVSGTFEDSMGRSHSISAYKWHINNDVFHVDQSDLNVGIVIAQNDSSNLAAPNKWSKLQWVMPQENTVWFCHTVTNANSSQDAIYLPSADKTNLQNGCLGGPWIPLSPN